MTARILSSKTGKIPISRDLAKAARQAFGVVPLTLLACLAGGAVSCFFSVKPMWLFLPAAVMGMTYVHMLRMTHWKSVSVFLAVCGVFACLGNVARALDLILTPRNAALSLSPGGLLLYNLLCWILTGISWRPATHAAQELLEDDALVRTWYVFWILPLLFVGLNLFMVPVYPEILYRGRLLEVYIVVSLALLSLLLLFYLMFYLMEASLRTAPARRRIRAQARLHSGHMVLLTVENAFDGEIREKGGGYSRFTYEGGIFCADVMLRGGT